MCFITQLQYISHIVPKSIQNARHPRVWRCVIVHCELLMSYREFIRPVDGDCFVLWFVLESRLRLRIVDTNFVKGKRLRYPPSKIKNEIPWKRLKLTMCCETHQGLYLLSRPTPYRQISRSLEAARFGFQLIQPLWTLAGTSAAPLPRCLWNIRTIR